MPSLQPPPELDTDGGDQQPAGAGELAPLPGGRQHRQQQHRVRLAAAGHPPVAERLELRRPRPGLRSVARNMQLRSVRAAARRGAGRRTQADVRDVHERRRLPAAQLPAAAARQPAQPVEHARRAAKRLQLPLLWRHVPAEPVRHDGNGAVLRLHVAPRHPAVRRRARASLHERGDAAELRYVLLRPRACERERELYERGINGRIKATPPTCSRYQNTIKCPSPVAITSPINVRLARLCRRRNYGDFISITNVLVFYRQSRG